MEKRTKKITIKKRIKQIAACVLSVFAFAVALVHPIGSVEAQAADSVTFSQAFYDSFEIVSKDDYFFQYYHPSLQKTIQIQVPEKGGPYFIYNALVPYTRSDKTEVYQYRFYMLYPNDDESSNDFRFFKPEDNDYARIGMSGMQWQDVIFKGQHYKMYCAYSDVYSDEERKSTFNMKYSVFEEVDQLTDFMTGESDYAGKIYNSNNKPADRFDESAAVYQKDLGYLMNLSKKTLMLYGDNASHDTSTAKYKFSYSQVSNSGFNLKQDNVYIRLYAQIAVYDKHGKGENVMQDMPKTFVGQYAASPLSFSVSAMDIYNANAELWSQINTTKWQWETVLHGYQRMDKLYFQIVQKNDDGTWNYGGYVSLGDKVSSTGEQISTAETQPPDGAENDDYSYTENIPTSSGVGSTYEDAEGVADANAKGDGGFSLVGFNGIVEIFNSFKEGLSSFTYAFGDFPNLIAETFPFLPAFITSAISLGFLVAVVLRLLGR